MGKIFWHLELKNPKAEETRLSLRIKLGDVRKSVALGHSVELKYWNKEKKRVIVQDVHTGTQSKGTINRYKKLNAFLDFLDAELPSLFEMHKDWDKVKPNPLTLKSPMDEVIEAVQRKIDIYNGVEKEEEENLTMTPTRFFEEYNKTIGDKTNKRTGTLMTGGTQTNYSVILKRFKGFLEYSKLDDSFAIFDDMFQQRWESYHYKGLTLKPNSLCQSNAILKIWLKQAVEKGLLPDNSSFRNLNSKGFSVEHTYLTDDEIQRIADIQFTDELKKEHGIDSKSSIEQSRDLFIIACKCGFRYSDLQQIGYSMIDTEAKTITLTTRKTQGRVVVPFGDMVESIIKKYEGNLPMVIDKSKFNNQIRTFCKIADIKDRIVVTDKAGGVVTKKEVEKWELITSHTARRSFATNMYLKSKDAQLVMKLTGHTTEANFMKYICLTQDENVERARAFV